MDHIALDQCIDLLYQSQTSQANGNYPASRQGSVGIGCLSATSQFWVGSLLFRSFSRLPPTALCPFFRQM